MFANDLPNGNGKFFFQNGETYEGNFIDGKGNDENGKYMFINNDFFIGGFKEGNKHGKGTYYFANGK